MTKQVLWNFLNIQAVLQYVLQYIFVLEYRLKSNQKQPYTQMCELLRVCPSDCIYLKNEMFVVFMGTCQRIVTMVNNNTF